MHKRLVVIILKDRELIKEGQVFAKFREVLLPLIPYNQFAYYLLISNCAPVNVNTIRNLVPA